MTTRQSNLAQIRQKFNMAFDDSSLSAFCFDYYPKVYDTFSQSMRKDEKITFLLDYCRRQPTGFETLLNDVQTEYKLSNFHREELKPLIDSIKKNAEPSFHPDDNQDKEPRISGSYNPLPAQTEPIRRIIKIIVGIIIAIAIITVGYSQSLGPEPLPPPTRTAPPTLPPTRTPTPTPTPKPIAEVTVSIDRIKLTGNHDDNTWPNADELEMYLFIRINNGDWVRVPTTGYYKLDKGERAPVGYALPKLYLEDDEDLTIEIEGWDGDDDAHDLMGEILLQYDLSGGDWTGGTYTERGSNPGNGSYEVTYTIKVDW